MVELSHDSRPIIGRGPPLTAYFLTLAAISVGLMVADQRYHQIDRIRESLSTVVYPMQRAVDFPFRATDWVTESFADRSRLRQENLELTARLRLANLQLQRFAVLEEENRRLREMRANTAGIAERVLVASILRVDLDPFRHRVLLDMGARDGVFKGQAVLDGEGIFGQVTKVNASTAEVILITDAEHAIPVQSNRSGVRTIAVGTGDENKLSLPFVTVEADLQEGDLLFSTGLGGVFPPGYPVARVSAVKRAGSTFASVEARPTAKLNQAREVLLIWFKAPAFEAETAADPAPAAAASPASGTTPSNVAAPATAPAVAKPKPVTNAPAATGAPAAAPSVEPAAAATSAPPPAAAEDAAPGTASPEATPARTPPTGTPGDAGALPQEGGQ
ncbi:MAG: rod shape-determining protein MreC [Gammaproteobacteria bacterium]|nr:rod shape-determining protein MreC [Gammaproteobacteria bacterium]MDH5175443.1 rod shape-determining protein MreC [Gammaproteobacteria bacterium]MDH5226277.1 rod shape-determining protein MreC [Gammaproteobacteria bacterium]